MPPIVSSPLPRTRNGSLTETLSELFRRSQLRSFKAVKTLKDLFPNTVATKGNLNQTPTELTCDSRRVSAGSLFFAVGGTRMDGHAFIPEAIARGACAIVSQEPLPADLPIATIQVASIKQAIADAARRYWGNPEKNLSIVGITGTKGKTTMTYLTKYLLEQQEKEVGMLTTIEYNLGNRSLPAYRTTPDALDIEAFFAQMNQAGCTHAVMEVSSHGLEQGRVLGIPFEIAVFNNLTPEHMDYHCDMESYYQAKKKLFTGAVGPKPKMAIINLDDPYGQRLYGELPEGVESLTFGTLPACDIQVVESSSCYEGSHFTLKLGNRRYKGWLPLVGAHNLSNAIGAIAIAYALGLSVKEAVATLENFKGVPGRLERIFNGQPFEVIVDYAHTDESLRCTLEALRPLYKGRIITLFGCGGNRDQSKRARMTRVAMEKSDYTIATADNPRREQLEDIFTMMKDGVVQGRPIEFVANRRQAIAGALRMAQPGDCVLIAGKGHETYQEFADAIVPFDDRQVAREVLTNLGFSRAQV